MFNKEQAFSIWEHEMGKKEYAYDFSGRKVKVSSYLEDNQVGWVITHLRPLDQGGKNNMGNTIIMHHQTFEERAFRYPKFNIGEKEYLIHYKEQEDYYYIEELVNYDDDDDGVIL
jgi:hypothetical protein